MLNVPPSEVAQGAAGNRVVILMPVLDDWDSMTALLRGIDRLYAGTGQRFDIVAVDDGSSVAVAPGGTLPAGGCIDNLRVIHLAANLGHQRAIAVGLSMIARREDVGAVVVMDSDGEDRPEDIATLLAAAGRHPGHVVLARRARRSEGAGFRLGYAAYKLLFRVLTGRVINFGNFCLLPIAAVRSLAHTPDLWNNLAATIMHSRLQRISVPTERGVRLAGQSRMNMAALVIHGLSAMSVWSDLIFVRVLIACAAGGMAAVLGAIAVVLVRFCTHFAIPGWASTMMGDLLIVLMQTIVIAVAATLMVLGNRSQRRVVPFADAPAFVASTRSIALARESIRESRPRTPSPVRAPASVATCPAQVAA